MIEVTVRNFLDLAKTHMQLKLGIDSLDSDILSKAKSCIARNFPAGLPYLTAELHLGWASILAEIGRYADALEHLKEAGLAFPSVAIQAKVDEVTRLQAKSKIPDECFSLRGRR